MEIPHICRYCGGIVRLVPAESVYGDSAVRLGLKSEKLYQCQNCNARVGCHKGTVRPLGDLANEVLRLKRIETHQVFDAYWTERGMSRTQAYRWLAKKMHLPERKAHIGGFEMHQCQKLIDLCRTANKAKENDMQETKLFTIIRTSARADRGDFPPPSAEGSYHDVELAQKAMQALVRTEKAQMDIPFSEDEYREESGPLFWEAYQDGYAAGWFTRYEIVESICKDVPAEVNT